ncbi:MAG: hypothetical protein R3F61_29770 [Myxococcota bacterium]
MTATRAWAPFVLPASVVLAALAASLIVLGALWVEAIPDPTVKPLSDPLAQACLDRQLGGRRCASLRALCSELPDLRTYSAMRVSELPAPRNPQPGMVYCGSGRENDPFTFRSQTRVPDTWTAPTGPVGDRLRSDYARVSAEPLRFMRAMGLLGRELKIEQALVREDVWQAELEAARPLGAGGAVFFLAFAVWMLPRQQTLRFGIRSIELGDTCIPLEDIQSVRMHGGRVVVETSRGRHRSAPLLYPDVAQDLLDALQRLTDRPFEPSGERGASGSAGSSEAHLEAMRTLSGRIRARSAVRPSSAG